MKNWGLFKENWKIFQNISQIFFGKFNNNFIDNFYFYRNFPKQSLIISIVLVLEKKAVAIFLISTFFVEKDSFSNWIWKQLEDEEKAASFREPFDRKSQ